MAYSENPFSYQKEDGERCGSKIQGSEKQGINRKEKDLHKEIEFTAFLIKAAHHIVDGNITFGAHIVCNWGNDA